MTKKTKIQYEDGSGNVFADLGLENSGELFTRAQVGIHVINAIKHAKLSGQKAIGKVLNIEQPEVSHLLNGHFSRFSTEKLMEFLNRLELKVSIQISEHKKGEPYKEVSFVHA
ncbi:MAG: XRE family transcriptional regulator [Flavobacteriales bacterium]|nr:XRE family transcriptional regulator [Candidatus Omnitrophota bacterium]MCA9409540.1 XRE family transcriptional regulator [Candidatus Omnitrophota bacterium]MCB0410103.1 XRE family transcriptional regulator [Flavobacteriales bacterium]